MIYRSSFIHTLCRYVQMRYGGVNLDQILDQSVMSMVEHDKAVIGLLAMILEKRMFIIDDMEFVGKKQSLNSAFLSVEQIKFVA